MNCSKRPICEKQKKVEKIDSFKDFLRASLTIHLLINSFILKVIHLPLDYRLPHVHTVFKSQVI